MLSISLATVLSDVLPRVLAAAVNFAVCGACIFYIHLSREDMRWSRSSRRFVTRHPEPAVFWTKIIFAAVASLVALAVGILILIPHAPTGDVLKLPTVDSVNTKPR
jgi:hypothetical protein